MFVYVVARTDESVPTESIEDVCATLEIAVEVAATLDGECAEDISIMEWEVNEGKIPFPDYTLTPDGGWMRLDDHWDREE